MSRERPPDLAGDASRDELPELLEYDDPDSDALSDDEPEPDELDRWRRCSFSPPFIANDMGLRGGAGGGDGYIYTKDKFLININNLICTIQMYCNVYTYTLAFVDWRSNARSFGIWRGW